MQCKASKYIYEYNLMVCSCTVYKTYLSTLSFVSKHNDSRGFVFPDHTPEVISGIREWALSGYECLPFVIALERERERERE